MTTSARSDVHADINVTPLIDVLLVLLITFMVITPLMPKGLEALVPQAPDHLLTAVQPHDPLVLQIGQDGTLRLNTQIVDRSQLSSALRGAFAKRQEKTLFVSASNDTEYRTIMTVLDEVRGFDPGIQVAVMK